MANVTLSDLLNRMKAGEELVQDYSETHAGLKPRDWWFLRKEGHRQEVGERVIRVALMKDLIKTEVLDGRTPKVWTLAK
jgi:hypothetical protein